MIKSTNQSGVKTNKQVCKCEDCGNKFSPAKPYFGKHPKCTTCRNKPKYDQVKCLGHSHDYFKKSGDYTEDQLNNVTFAPDPYRHELYDDETPVWMCEACRYESYMDT